MKKILAAAVRFLEALKALSTKAKLLLGGAATALGLTALVLGMLSPDVPNPIGPEPCVFVIPIATPGHWMCPEGVSPPEMTR